MAVVNAYTDSNIDATTGQVNKLLNALASGGARVGAMLATFEVAAADSDGSIYRVFKDVEPTLVPLAVLIANDAITGGTDWDVGIYAPDLGDVKVADCISGGTAIDLSSAHANLLPGTAANGFAGLAIDNPRKKIYEYAGDLLATKLGAYDIALTANTVGSAAGTITVLFLFAQG